MYHFKDFKEEYLKKIERNESVVSHVKVQFQQKKVMLNKIDKIFFLFNQKLYCEFESDSENGSSEEEID